MKFSYKIKQNDLTDKGARLVELYREYHKKDQSELIKTLIESEVKGKYGPGKEILNTMKDTTSLTDFLLAIPILVNGGSLVSENIRKAIDTEKIGFVQNCVKATLVCEKSYPNVNVDVSDIRVIDLYDEKNNLVAIHLVRDANLGEINELARELGACGENESTTEAHRKFALDWTSTYFKTVLRKQLDMEGLNSSVLFSQPMVKNSEVIFSVIISLPLLALYDDDIEYLVKELLNLNVSDILPRNM